MTPERWQRVEAIFQAALEADGPARTALLNRSCGDDPTLRLEVESLLAMDARSEQVIAGAVEGSAALFQADQLGLAAGERLGIYRVVREIGRGGMGTVYLAERDDEQFHKQVAIKLVTRGMDTTALLGRFRQERQILARLDHPHIARLLDGGSTADGRPYLVIEYVEGQPITNWCAARGLGIEERVALFLKVCAAVESAHQNLVVHRDLKPGNILVDNDGSPKLLDFGIAKLLGADETSQLTIAAGGMHMLTPDYASPEQVRGEAITTSTDVYALGAILYELVSGVRPHRLQDYTLADIERAVCTEVPEKPSTAWKRSTAAGQETLTPVLKAGDLDNIVLMAMQKEPARRYGSVVELSEDLRRYLAGLPVRAREDTLAYRYGKFIRRHRVGVAATAMLAATLAAGVTVSAIEARRAERRFNQVRRLAHTVLYTVYDAIRDLDGSVKARETIVTTALEYLDGLEHESAGEPGLRLELAEAYERVGDVQGNALERSLGNTVQALESYRKAMAIADGLAAGAESGRANPLRQRMRENIGDILAQRGNRTAALQIYGEGVEIGEAAARRDPSNRENLRFLSNLYSASAREDTDRSRALGKSRKGVAIMEELAAAEPASLPAGEALASGYSTLSSILATTGKLDEALQEARKAVSIRESLVAAHPNNARYRRDLMLAYSKVADAFNAVSLLGGNAESLEYLHKALALAEALAAADPADRHAVMDVGMALWKTADAMPVEHAPGAAVAMLRRAQAVFQSLADADRGDTRRWSFIAGTHAHIALRLAAVGDVAGAVRSHRAAIRICEDVISKDPRDRACMDYSWSAYQEIAKLSAGGGQRAEALDLSSRAIRTAQAALAIDRSNAVTQSWLPQAYTTAGEVRAALAGALNAPVAQRLEDWRQALDFYQKAVAAWEPIPAQRTIDRDGGMAKARAGVDHCTKAMAVLR